MQHILLKQAPPARVRSWRFEPGELVVLFEGAQGECCPLCRCGRGHFLVHAVHGPPARLDLTCHHCGTRFTFDLV